MFSISISAFLPPQQSNSISIYILFVQTYIYTQALEFMLIEMNLAEDLKTRATQCFYLYNNKLLTY